MDGYQFIATLFQSLVSLAWPAAVFGSVWLFRGKLLELLPHLNVRHKDWEFRFEKAEKEAAALPAPPPADAPPTPEENDRFEQIAKLSPRAAIVEVRANLEEAVRAFGRAVGVKITNTNASYATLIRLLRQEGLIDANTSALLDDLRAIGNAAAHNQSEPSEQDALRFKALADKLIAQFGISTAAAQMPPPGSISHGSP